MTADLPLFPLSAWAYPAGQGGTTYDLRPLGRPFLVTVYPPTWASKGYHQIVWQEYGLAPVAEFCKPEDLLTVLIAPWAGMPTEQLIRVIQDMGASQIRSRLIAKLRVLKAAAEQRRTATLETQTEAGHKLQAIERELDDLGAALEGLRDE